MNGQRKSTKQPSARPVEQVDAWCGRFVEECRRRGIRVTSQRLAVYRAVAADLSHPTVEAVHRRIPPQMESMSLGTVYRILEFLEAEGLLRRVSTTESVCRFDANLDGHQHLACRACGAIRDLEDGALGGLRVPRRLPRGFRGEALDIRVVGVCEACARSGGKIG